MAEDAGPLRVIEESPAYWRIVFDYPPFNIVDARLYQALQDLLAQRNGAPLWRLWGLDSARIPPCWRTLSIPSSEKELCDMLDEGMSRGSTRIKLKTGSGDLGWDEDCVRLIRERPVRLDRGGRHAFPVRP